MRRSSACFAVTSPEDQPQFCTRLPATMYQPSSGTKKPGLKGGRP